MTYLSVCYRDVSVEDAVNATDENLSACERIFIKTVLLENILYA